MVGGKRHDVEGWGGKSKKMEGGDLSPNRHVSLMTAMPAYEYCTNHKNHLTYSFAHVRNGDLDDLDDHCYWRLLLYLDLF